MDKGLTVYIHKSPLGECSNGGISSKCDTVTVMGIERGEISEPTDAAPAVKLVKGTIGGEPHVHAEPVEPPPDGHAGWMMGGSYIAASDSRFRRAVGFYGAVAFHDRSETPASLVQTLA